MDDRSRIAISVLVGAAVGGVVGYLAFTEAGRRSRDTLRGQLDDLLDDAHRLSGSVAQMQGVASDGWRGVREFFSALAADDESHEDPNHGTQVS